MGTEKIKGYMLHLMAHKFSFNTTSSAMNQAYQLGPLQL